MGLIFENGEFKVAEVTTVPVNIPNPPPTIEERVEAAEAAINDIAEVIYNG